MGPRYVDGCAQRGFQAIEIDNLDTFWRAPGLITMDHNIAYATLLTKYAHDKGLAVGQKNAMELGARGKNEAKFDVSIIFLSVLTFHLPLPPYVLLSC